MDLKNESNYNVGKYLKKVNETFKNEQKKSLSDILSDFQCVSEDYQKFNEELLNSKIEYSNYRFDKCTLEEQKRFIDDQLQLIETLVADKIYSHDGVVWNWYDIFSLMHNEDYKLFKKENRKVVFSTSQSIRPVGDQSFNLWNGLQIIDIDIKNESIALGLKEILFDELKKYQWFLGVCLSSSGRSLHVWTKIKPISIDLASRRIEFRCNFRQKYSYIYIILSKYMNRFGYSKEDIIHYLDNAMAKPQQGVFISSDSNALMNTFFRDLRLDATFESAVNTGIESINWITHPDLKAVFAKLEWFDNDAFNKENNVDISNIEGIDERNPRKDKGPIHYKHNQRWQIANTLNAIYGADKAMELIVQICAGTSRKELKGDIRTANFHKKPISKWAVNELNEKHGFCIKIKEDLNEYKKNVQEIDKKLANLNAEYNPINVLNEHTKKISLYLTKDQYLSDIKDDILKNLSKITLLDAGAGYGKTEMIKAFKSRVLLILPFTSIIKSKIELDENTKDWLYYYGSKRPTLDELLDPTHSITMTIDKFAKINLMELDQAAFDYIVVDESHLLFTSSYRDVMSPTIQRLANCKSKVIMMTGTPTAEVLFFPKVNHIIVKREETRVKDFTIYMTPTENEQKIEMARSMARDIKNGIKILWPTNRGTTYFEQITDIVEYEYNKLENKSDNPSPRRLKTFYYKKSNYGDDSMDNINRNKSIGDNDIIGCTTYLSVGVDICDAKKFHVYFDNTLISQDIEQYANRLRRNDLYIKMFLPITIGGSTIDYKTVRNLSLKFEESELVFIRDLARTANDMIERNEDESKYNPLVVSMLTTNNFLRYDEVDCRYYIDETAYKLKVFEERYKDYACQLNVLKKDMQYYGYTVSTEVLTNIIPPENIEEFDNRMRDIKHRRWDENTLGVRKLLAHLNDDNIDFYRQITKGNVAIFKDKEYEEERGENNIYAESIEILEKNTPIIMSLYRFYSIDVIKDIYEWCIDKKSNRLNYTKLDRIRRYVNIQYNKERKKLDFPILKFVKDARTFANEHPSVTSEEIVQWKANYTTEYANSIEGLVVQDNKYLDEIYSLVDHLWNVVIIQSRPNKGKITIEPFELLWTRKDILEDIYGNENTHQFLIQVLDDEMNKNKKNEEDDEPVGKFVRKSKISIDDIKPEIKNIVHDDYEYDKYSDLDNSNERFLRKERNTERKPFISTRKEEEVKPVINNESNDTEPTIWSDKELNPNIEDLPI